MIYLYLQPRNLICNITRYNQSLISTPSYLHTIYQLPSKTFLSLSNPSTSFSNLSIVLPNSSTTPRQ